MQKQVKEKKIKEATAVVEDGAESKHETSQVVDVNPEVASETKPETEPINDEEKFEFKLNFSSDAFVAENIPENLDDETRATIKEQEELVREASKFLRGVVIPNMVR